METGLLKAWRAKRGINESDRLASVINDEYRYNMQMKGVYKEVLSMLKHGQTVEVV